MERKPVTFNMDYLYSFAETTNVFIDGRPFITGRPNLWPAEYFGLRPGMKVCKIGKPGRNGNITSSHRVDTWMPWIQYSGTIYLPQIDNETEKCKYMAFMLPPGGLLKKDSREAVAAPYYAVYVICGDELVRPNTRRSTIEIFKPVFTLTDGSIINHKL